MTAGLHLVSIPIDIAALLRNANDPSIGQSALDLGYHVHGWLSRTLGKGTLRPYILQPHRILGYASLDAGALRERVDAFADPGEHRVVTGEIQSKAMPLLGEGRRVDFDARVAPTVRLASASGDIPEGSELDAYLAHRERTPKEQRKPRTQVYLDWFTERLSRGGAAAIERLEVVQVKQTRVLRRTQQRQRKTVAFTLPEVSVSGTLATGPGFDALLRQGVGRHKAFGFGMLLLRPPSC